MTPWIRYAVFGSACGCFAFALGGCYQAIAHSLLYDEAIRFGARMPGWLFLGALAGALIGLVTWWSDIFAAPYDGPPCKSHEPTTCVHTRNLCVWSQRFPSMPLMGSEPNAARSLLQRRIP